MGILRFILAHVVMLVHLAPLFPKNIAPFLWADPITSAVSFHIFFIISGFCTALLVHEYSVQGKAIKSYYIRRFVKLLPVYYITLALTVLLTLYADSYYSPELPKVNRLLPYYYRINTSDNVELVSQNVFFFIPELFRFFNFTHARVDHVLFMPQAWSLSVCFAFILLAPFLLRNKWAYAGAWGVAIVYAVWMNAHGFYRNYFAVSLLFFMAGTLGYRFYATRLLPRTLSRMEFRLSYGSILALAALFYTYAACEALVGAYVLYWFMLIFAALAIPYIFKASQNTSWDKYLGELAYPMYLSHFLIADLMKILLEYHPQRQIGFYAWIATLTYAALTTFGVTVPMMRLGQKRPKITSHC